MIANESVNQAISYIPSNAKEGVSVNEIAQHCNFSEYHFSRLFKQATGESVYHFVARTKLEGSAFAIKTNRLYFS